MLRFLSNLTGMNETAVFIGAGVFLLVFLVFAIVLFLVPGPVCEELDEGVFKIPAAAEPVKAPAPSRPTRVRSRKRPAKKAAKPAAAVTPAKKAAKPSPAKKAARKR